MKREIMPNAFSALVAVVDSNYQSDNLDAKLAAIEYDEQYGPNHVPSFTCYAFEYNSAQQVTKEVVYGENPTLRFRGHRQLLRRASQRQYAGKLQ